MYESEFLYTNQAQGIEARLMCKYSLKEIDG